jgi:hypothetical protein
LRRVIRAWAHGRGDSIWSMYVGVSR